MLARIAAWVIAAVDLGVLAYCAVRERRLHPEFLKERLDHQLLVVVASALLSAQIGTLGLASSRRSLGASIARNVAAGVALSGAALFNAASLLVLSVPIWDLANHGLDPQRPRPAELAMIAVWILANLWGFVAGWRRRPWAAASPIPAPESAGRSAR
jgi:hypothetical protein